MTGAVLSEKNPLVKQIRRAIARGGLTEDGCAVAESFHLLEEALRSDCEIRVIVAAESVRSTVAAHVRGLKRTRLVSLDDAVFRELASTESPQGVLALVRPPASTLDQLLRGPTLLLVLDV